MLPGLSKVSQSTQWTCAAFQIFQSSLTFCCLSGQTCQMPKCPGRASTCFCISDLTRMFKMFKVVRKSFVKTLRDPMGRIFGTAIGPKWSQYINEISIGRIGRATSATNVAKWHGSSFGLKSADSKSLSGSFPAIRSILWKIWWQKIIEAMTCTRWVAITWYNQGSERGCTAKLINGLEAAFETYTPHLFIRISRFNLQTKEVQSPKRPNMSKHIFQDLPRFLGYGSSAFILIHWTLTLPGDPTPFGCGPQR